jgi:hypothetical protein
MSVQYGSDAFTNEWLVNILYSSGRHNNYGKLLLAYENTCSVLEKGSSLTKLNGPDMRSKSRNGTIRRSTKQLSTSESNRLIIKLC